MFGGVANNFPAKFPRQLDYLAGKVSDLQNSCNMQHAAEQRCYCCYLSCALHTCEYILDSTKAIKILQ